MSTRAASAANSLRAKQALVKVLFAHKYSGKGPQARKMLDHSIYTYDELRAAYLERVQQLHPDKYHDKRTLNDSVTMDKEDAKRQFVDLREAWNRYEDVAKLMKRVSGGDETAANFTLFGVGCSFSDNEEERNLRNEIMDQASRGWFSSGSLVERDSEKENGRTTSTVTKGPLCDDELFTCEERTTEDTDSKNSLDSLESPRRSLVSHLIRPSRRR